MKSVPWSDPRLASVRADAVRSYLLGHGWRLQPYPGPELFVFAGPSDDDGEQIVQVLPSSEHLRDFPLRVEELIASLSVIESRPAADIITDILRESPTPPAPNGAASPASPRPTLP